MNENLWHSIFFIILCRTSATLTRWVTRETCCVNIGKMPGMVKDLRKVKIDRSAPASQATMHAGNRPIITDDEIPNDKHQMTNKSQISIFNDQNLLLFTTGIKFQSLKMWKLWS
jgi:hypothetical protein